MWVRASIGRSALGVCSFFFSGSKWFGGAVGKGHGLEVLNGFDRFEEGMSLEYYYVGSSAVCLAGAVDLAT